LPYIPGSPIEAYCLSCQKDENHVVLEADGMQVRLVRCEKCGEEGVLRAPRAKTKAALLEFAQKKKKKAVPQKRKTRRKNVSPEEVFRELAQSFDLNQPLTYSIKAVVEPGDVVEHPTFGIGIVTSLSGPDKAKICFESGERTMICNRN
jgi:hypothetical protein